MGLQEFIRHLTRLYDAMRQKNNGAQQLASEATVYIMLEDVNDEIPLFTEREQETVLEGEPIGTKVTQVNAIDKDGTFPNNQNRNRRSKMASRCAKKAPTFATICWVYYYIVDSPRNEGKEFFEINLQSGEIFTKTVFDREKKGAYALEVEARDGAPSARPNSNGQPNSEHTYDYVCSSEYEYEQTYECEYELEPKPKQEREYACN
ncbi:hypothetical protein GQX74_009193 [Glossina fuscipes]|nr:hypothetical protein GQX74_009193 [Glossina fuscipes]